MANQRLPFSTLLVLSCLIYLQTTWAEVEPDQDSDESYEVIGTSAGAGSENGIEGTNYQHVGLFHSRRQKRSPHLGGLGHGNGLGLYGQTHYRPVYVQPHPVYVQPRPVYVQPRPIYPQHGGYGGHPHPVSNSQSQAQAISANFVGPHGSSAISGAAASAGGGAASHPNYIGYGRK